MGIHGDQEIAVSTLGCDGYFLADCYCLYIILIDFPYNVIYIYLVILLVIKRHVYFTVTQSNSQKVKATHKIRVQTSKIVSSFKAPSFTCQLIREFTGHKDGIWDVTCAKPGQALIGTASAGNYMLYFLN